MLDIGTLKNVKRYKEDSLHVSEIIEKERHNHVVLLVGDELDTNTQNTTAEIGLVPFEKWRVIGAGLLCTEATTDAEDPVFHFGTRADPDTVAIATITAGSGKALQLDEYSSYDQYGILPADVLTEVSIAWTEEETGSIWNSWQTTISRLLCKTVSASITSGKIIPYILIEVDSGGKF